MRQAALGLTALAACGLTVGCAASSRDADPMGRAISQPARDLSLMRDALPAVLTRAADAPYAPPKDGGCPELAREIADLDGVLGPDVDATVSGSKTDAGKALASAVPGIPFRGVVREMTGAAARDREQQRIILAGVARRGFLKGLAHSLACPPAA